MTSIAQQEAIRPVQDMQSEAPAVDLGAFSRGCAPEVWYLRCKRAVSLMRISAGTTIHDTATFALEDCRQVLEACRKGDVVAAHAAAERLRARLEAGAAEGAGEEAEAQGIYDATDSVLRALGWRDTGDGEDPLLYLCGGEDDRRLAASDLGLAVRVRALVAEAERQRAVLGIVDEKAEVRQ